MLLPHPLFFHGVGPLELESQMAWRCPSRALSCRRQGFLLDDSSVARPLQAAVSSLRHAACNTFASPLRPREAWANWDALNHSFLSIRRCLLHALPLTSL